MKKLFLFTIFLICGISLFAQNGAALGDGALIRRPVKDVQFLYHYGVLLGGKIVHFNQTGLHVSTLEEFCDDAEVKVLRKGITGEDLKVFKVRATQLIAKYKNTPYDVVKNNCEHFAIEMVFGIKKSIQSDGAKDYIKTYYPIMREKMLKENPKSEIYVKLIDAYFQRFLTDKS